MNLYQYSTGTYTVPSIIIDHSGPRFALLLTAIDAYTACRLIEVRTAYAVCTSDSWQVVGSLLYFDDPTTLTRLLWAESPRISVCHDWVHAIAVEPMPNRICRNYAWDPTVLIAFVSGIKEHMRSVISAGKSSELQRHHVDNTLACVGLALLPNTEVTSTYRYSTDFQDRRIHRIWPRRRQGWHSGTAPISSRIAAGLAVRVLVRL